MRPSRKSRRSPRRDFVGNEKAATGIVGLDQVMQGGLPRARTTLVFGGPGCGKTVLALQVLVNGARQWNEPGIFVAFEENSRQVIANAASFGWDLPELQKRRLFFLDAHLGADVVRAGKFDLKGMLEGLAVKVREIGAKRLVFDGIDVLLTLLDDRSSERAELSRIQEWLVAQGLTGILTAKALSDEPFSHAQYAFAAYMADCALLLTRRHQNVVSERDLTILKYRGSAFSENKAPFLIASSGIEVADQHFEPEPTRATTERVSTGVPRFDTMLKGGYFRGSTVLITGLPGTAKSSLCGAFIEAACRRRERALYMSFDEQSGETIRNLASIGIRLQPFVGSGQLGMRSALSLTDSAEVQLMRIRSAIREHRATCVVVDPISALAKSSDVGIAIGVLARFIHYTKVSGITLVCTSLLSSPEPHREGAELGASTLADTWVHLSYAQYGGERNRGLTIIKSRGTGHSNQVRELVLSEQGITLADVYEAGGEVFMGAMRWQRENLERDEERRLEMDAQKRRAELERSAAELRARQELLSREIVLNEKEIEMASQAESNRLERIARRRSELLRQRGADEESSSSKNGALRTGNGTSPRGRATPKVGQA